MSDQVFNRDILANDDDADILARDYPALADWLKWDELVKAFHHGEAAAAKAKGRAHRNGRAAVWLSFLAVLIVTITPTATILINALRPSSDQPAAIWTAVSLTLKYGWLVALALSFLCAAGALYGHRRAVWLDNRATCERLRQLFFQHLAQWFDHLTSQDPTDRTRALDARPVLLARVLSDHDRAAGPVTQKLVDDATLKHWQLVDVPATPAKGAQDPVAAQALYTYIERRRLAFQQNHALRLLDTSAIKGSVSVARRLSHHKRLAAFLTAVFVTFQLVTGILYLTGDTVLVAPTTPLLHPTLIANLVVFAQTIALIAAAWLVALKGIEAGMHLRPDVTRYRNYAGLTARIMDRLSTDMLITDDSRTQMRRHMMQMELLAYWELREFLALHRENAFSF